MEITVAGTVQASHLIPFYALAEHHGITKSGAKLHIFYISCNEIQLFFLFFPLFMLEYRRKSVSLHPESGNRVADAAQM